MPTPPDSLSITEIAEHLGVSRWTAARALTDAGLPTVEQTGERWPRIAADAYRAWLIGRVVAPEQEDLQVTTAQLPDLIPFDEVAERYGLSLRSLKESARSRKFSHVHIGHSRYFTPGQLEAFLAARTVESTGAQARDSMRGRRARRHPTSTRTAA